MKSVGLGNFYYDVNLKYDRLKELGKDKEEIEDKKLTTSSIFSKHTVVKLDLSPSISL